MKPLKKIFFLLSIVMIAAAIATACSNAAPRGNAERETPFTRTRAELLGTLITISVFDAAPSDEELDALLDRCFLEIENIEARMSVNRADSEISAINRAGGEASVEVSGDLYRLISRAKEISDMSDGAFDITIGPITALWKNDGAFERLPPEDEIRERLPLVGDDGLDLTAPNSARLAERGMALDAGGIAKGYACDKIVAILREAGIEHAVLDLGGNVYVLGKKPDGSDWRVGVRLPLIGEDGVVCIIETSDISVVTSGGYERFFERDGKTYHHLLDPKTGYPAQSGLLSATVIAGVSADADGLSTACFVLGLEKGMRLLEENGYEGVFIGEDRIVRVTGGLKDAVLINDERFSFE
ncbi:MAG: FAD:protein FMN transferase [Clostridiales Family XIII bacterium]|nr:FAD:protein FMN transferase [Clostridiales Family XIII bacterium]